MLDNQPPFNAALRRALGEDFLADEDNLAKRLSDSIDTPPAVHQQAWQWVDNLRRQPARKGLIQAFLREYDLASEEGVVLMCLAEALLRIPDGDTADHLISDRFDSASWEQHLGHSDSLWVNASTWGLMFSGRLLQLKEKGGAAQMLNQLSARLGEPVIRQALKSAMRILGHQFVMGEDIAKALARSRQKENLAYRHSFDMLGEAALTGADAEKYFHSYLDAIAALGHQGPHASVMAAPGISVKLSALHARYSVNQRQRVLAELPPRLLALAQAARSAGIAMTVDAEEADRLELSLEVFALVYADASLADWPGFGLAVQAYLKRAPGVIQWLAELAAQHGRRIPVRLVKGAYWDSEIKRAQERGLADYPVYTRKVNTDIAYLACARLLLDHGEAFYPQFASHNAYSVAWIRHAAGDAEYEFQRLHGMGEALYEEVLKDEAGPPCRVYAPVGRYQELLPYLVRRLLENGANSSFVHRLEDPQVDIDKVIAEPLAANEGRESLRHARIPLPRHLFPNGRLNSRGDNLADYAELEAMAQTLAGFQGRQYTAVPLIDDQRMTGEEQECHSPADLTHRLGHVIHADSTMAAKALASAARHQPEWDRLGGEARARILESAADALERNRLELAWLTIHEGGRCLGDALNEVREAVDFCRYYAAEARRNFAADTPLPGPTGEENLLRLRGRGVFAAISPWNFPLAIFCGQIAAALAAGNSVVAKPASLTPLCGMRVIELLREAGVPPGVLHFLPMAARDFSHGVLGHEHLAGVVFTGSTTSARQIQHSLASRDGPILPLVAETGGLNAMIVDSSALPEQVVSDVIQSAFNSAGQRCSALRVLFVQEDIAPAICALLKGAMMELNIGHPAQLDTDLGPLIDARARQNMNDHLQRLGAESLLFATPVDEELAERGHYFAPHLLRLERMSQLSEEVFGPILHFISYRGSHLDQVIETINASGYGLTLGIHSRIRRRARDIARRVRAGNVYINRNMIGAVVGVQPFGGQGLSGTGPKAGGPHYLSRFATEQTLSDNIAALGGNATLLGLDDE